MVDPIGMGKDKSTGNQAVMAHVYTGAYQELDLLTRYHHLAIWWKNLLCLSWHPGRVHLN